MTSRTPLLATTLGLALVAGILTTGRIANAQDGFGTIKGRLVWGGAKLPEPAPKVKKGDANVKDAAVCAAADIPDEAYVVDPATKGVADGFAYVTGPKGKNPDAHTALLEKTPAVVIDQKGCQFIPHVVAMHKDQELVFKSSDPVVHNIRYTGFTIGSLNQVVAANGKLPVKFTKTERNPVKLFCDFHPWMTGAFMVFDHPFFAVTKPDGSFEIKGVPAGAQQFIVRHPEHGYVTTGAAKGIAVNVPAGGEVDLGEIKLAPK
jgi:hypothetical protein